MAITLMFYKKIIPKLLPIMVSENYFGAINFSLKVSLFFQLRLILLEMYFKANLTPEKAYG